MFSFLKRFFGRASNPSEPDERTSLDLTPGHIALLRRMQFVWDESESGAPVAHPDAPYGPGDLFDIIGAAFGMTPAERGPNGAAWSEAQRAEIWRIHSQDMADALMVMALHAKTKPGRYEIDLRPFKAFHGDEMPDLRFDSDRQTEQPLDLRGDAILFDFTPDHGELLANAYFRWCHWLDAPGIDSKRPYASTYYPGDVAAILGHDYDPNSDEDLPIEEETLFAKLHAETLLALYILVRHGAITPRRYRF